MIKILYIAPVSVNRKQGSGGVETASENILDGFSNIKGLEIIVLSFRNENIKNSVSKFSDNISIIQRGKKIKSTILNILFHQRKVVREIISKEKPDLIHFHGTGPNILSVSNLPSEQVIITQHGINRIELKYQDNLKNKIKFLFKSVIEKLYFPRFSNCILISNNNLAFTEKYFKTQLPNYTVVPNSVNTDFMEIPRKNKTSNNILYVGYISRLKNLLLLLKVLNKLSMETKNYNLTIVGKIKDNKYYEECCQFIKNNKLANMVTFKGYVNQNELQELYKEMDIFVLPSLQENNPISLMEAMAAGKVSAASNVGGIPELIDNGRTGYLFEKNNFIDLYKILSNLHNNSSIVKSIGTNAREYILENHAPNYISRLIFKYYKSIVNNQSND